MSAPDNKASTGKRKYHQKSRKGCLTCKKRRVKCDEQKPRCKKCANLNLVCGYLDLNEPEPQPLSANQFLQPSPPSALSPDVSLHLLLPGVSQTKSTRSSISSPEMIPKARTYSQTSEGSAPSKPKDPPAKRVKVEPQDLQPEQDPQPQEGQSADAKKPTMASLLNAGNLNNINLSHLVHSLTELGGDLSSLGNLASLTNLATLAQLPIDISNLGTLIDSQLHNTYNKSMSGNNNMMNGSGSNGFSNGSSSSSTNIPSETSANDPMDQTNPTENTTNSNGANATPKPKIPNISPNILQSFTDPMAAGMGSSNLNMLDLRLMFHYTSQVASTITGAGISDTNIWNYDIPMLAFDHPFLMHSILAFSATHLSRTEKGLDQCVTYHRGDALRLLREAVLDINSDNTDALVASALILIMDSLANASLPSSTSPKSLPASAWIFHVKGAATILTAVWPLTEASRFYKFISVDLGDLGDIINQKVHLNKDTLTNKTDKFLTDLKCHDSDIADLFPVSIDSPYLITLAYLNKLHNERYKSDFILRIFAFPALLDKQFLSLLMSGDIKAMRIMRSYYKLLRSFTMEMKNKVWFLEGVANILPVDVEEYAGGAGGMHMMLDFLGGGPSIVDNEIDEEIAKFDSSNLTNKLVDTNNLPSDITSDLEIMQAADTFMNMK